MKFSLTLSLLALCCIGCQTARVTSQQDFGKPAPATPGIVYVTDFELGAYQIQHQEGVLSAGPGPVGRVGGVLTGSEDPVVRARELVELMATSLVKNLEKAGLSARRIQHGLPLPSEGLLLRGIFTEVQEGNRVRRAMIGFGQGQTHIQVIAVVDDLSKGTPKPLYQIGTDASSGQKPGGAPMLVLSPYGAAARFVLAANDLQKNVKQTAAQIADRIASRQKEATAK